MTHQYAPGDEPVPGFRLTKFMGDGSFGRVWRARGPGGTEVAVKIIDLQDTYGLKELRALRLIKRIRHPNIVPLTGFWLTDADGNLLDAANLSDSSIASQSSSGTLTCQSQVDTLRELIVIMGLGDMSLQDRLHQCQADGLVGIPLRELLGYIKDTARAIDYLNSKRHALSGEMVAIQHCDIKPQNILIVGGAAQVCDLGLARVLDDGRQTRLAFSAAYAAPEFLAGSSPGPATDQYSLAVSYVELRTGRLPLDDQSSPARIIQQHLENRLDLAALPLGERKVIEQATALDPERRFPNALALATALRREYRKSETGGWRGRSTTITCVDSRGGRQARAVSARGRRRMPRILAAIAISVLLAAAAHVGPRLQQKANLARGLSRLQTFWHAPKASSRPVQSLPSTDRPQKTVAAEPPKPAKATRPAAAVAKPVASAAPEPIATVPIVLSPWVNSQWGRLRMRAAEAMGPAIGWLAQNVVPLPRRFVDACDTLRGWEGDQSLRRGIAALEQRDYQAAMRQLDRALMLTGQDPRARAYHGLVWACQGQWDRAIVDYSEAIGANNDLGLAYRLRGIAEAKLGRLTRALDDLTRATALDPEDQAARRVRALIHLKRGQFQQALDQQAAIRYGPADAVLLSLRIRAPTYILDELTNRALPVWEPSAQLLHLGDDGRRVLVQVEHQGQRVVGWLPRDDVKAHVPF